MPIRYIPFINGHFYHIFNRGVEKRRIFLDKREHRRFIDTLTYYRYQNDIWVLTNQRLIDSYKAHWFSHRMVTADLVNIQNILAHREGLFQTWLNFGDLECETAGERQRFILAGIPRPSDALAEVDRARDAARVIR